jgi:hypothetical protein
MFSVVFSYHYAECHYAECHYAECPNAECHLCVASCFYIVMLSVIILIVVMLSVIILIVVMLSVIMLNVVMLNVLAPIQIVYLYLRDDAGNFF